MKIFNKEFLKGFFKGFFEGLSLGFIIFCLVYFILVLFFNGMFWFMTDESVECYQPTLNLYTLLTGK